MFSIKERKYYGYGFLYSPINHLNFGIQFDYAFYSKVGLAAAARPLTSMSKVLCKSPVNFLQDIFESQLQLYVGVSSSLSENSINVGDYMQCLTNRYVQNHCLTQQQCMDMDLNLIMIYLGNYIIRFSLGN